MSEGPSVSRGSSGARLDHIGGSDMEITRARSGSCRWPGCAGSSPRSRPRVEAASSSGNEQEQAAIKLITDFFASWASQDVSKLAAFMDDYCEFQGAPWDTLWRGPAQGDAPHERLPGWRAGSWPARSAARTAQSLILARCARPMSASDECSSLSSGVFRACAPTPRPCEEDAGGL